VGVAVLYVMHQDSLGPDAFQYIVQPPVPFPVPVHEAWAVDIGGHAQILQPGGEDLGKYETAMKLVLMILVGSLVLGACLDRMDARGYSALLAIIVGSLLLAYITF